MQEVDVFIDSLVDQLAVAEARANGDYLTTRSVVNETTADLVEPAPGVVDIAPVTTETAEQS
jgi:hypothetical protein